MHFVRLRFEPAKIAFDPVPRAWPLVFLVLAVIRLAIDDPLLPFRRQLFEGHIGRHAELPGGTHHVALGFRTGARAPWLHGAARECERPVRQRAIVIDGDHAPEAATLRACADGMIEAEQRGDGLAIFDVAARAMIAAGEFFAVDELIGNPLKRLRHVPQHHTPLKGGVNGVGTARKRGGIWLVVQRDVRL